jgi:hypothetical protein
LGALANRALAVVVASRSISSHAFVPFQRNAPLGF